MPKINGKIYYNNVTGNVLLVVNQNEGVWLRETTFAEDVATYPQLKEVTSNVISVVRLAWDQYKQDFTVARPVRVEDGKVKWELFDANPEQPPELSISEQLAKVERDNIENKQLITMLEDMLVFLTMP